MLTPPRLLSDLEVGYPVGETEDVTVEVTLVVGTTGTVEEATPSEAHEPFRTLAKNAGLKARFAAARRGDKPVRARIRIEIAFHKPAPPTAAQPEPTPETREAAKSSAAVEAIEEVRVLGAREVEGPVVVSLGRAEVRLLPGAFGDPYRAIDVLPGVTPTVSGLPYYYIRGAPPSNVTYLVDGVRVPYLFHFGLGPGVLQPALIERVDLYPGALPARFGGAAGAVIAGETATPKDQAWGEASIRLIDTGGYVEAPLLDGRMHVGLGGRFSYTAFLLSVVAPDVTVAYRDYNARVTYDLTPKDRLTLFTFGAFDLAATKDSESENVLFASEFHRLDLRWDRKWDNGGSSRVSVSTGLDRTRLEARRFARMFPVSARAEFAEPLTSSLNWRAGAHGLFEFYGGDIPSRWAVSQQEFEQAERFFTDRTDVWSGAWTDLVVKLPGNIEVTPGARFDVFASKGNSETAVDPRIAVKVPITERVRFVSSHGTSHQPPAFAIPLPAVQVPGLPGGLQTIYQSTLGAEVDLPQSMTATTSVFRNAFRHTSDLFAISNNDGPFGAQLPLSGRAYGLELSLRRKFSTRIGGFASYTLSRNERLIGREYIPNGFDRTHVLNVAMSVDLGKGFRLGSRFLYYSGTPTFQGTVDRITGRDSQTNAPYRVPDFYRVDARFEKRWSIANSRAWVSLVVEGLNVTLSKETLSYNCNEGACRPDSFGPITVPSIGVEAGF